ncbi:Unknown protein, partial [Striga hermonthica]
GGKGRRKNDASQSYPPQPQVFDAENIRSIVREVVTEVVKDEMRIFSERMEMKMDRMEMNMETKMNNFFDRIENLVFQAKDGPSTRATYDGTNVDEEVDLEINMRDTETARSVDVPTQATVVAQFRDYHAEKFSGQGDPRIVDEWIQGLEFIFEVMECRERYRVICAQLQLTGDARLWWNGYWSMRPGEKAGCTWEMFKELIREKYYPTYYRAEMEHQFLSLQQGTRTVDEYEREFTRLAAFVPDLVRTEAQRAQRFIDGLYPAVRHNIVGHGTQTYARAVSIAQEVDASIRREAVREQFQPSAPAQSSSVPPLPALPSTQPPKNNKRKGKGAQADKRTRRRLQQIPQCPTCGRLHRGE